MNSQIERIRFLDDGSYGEYVQQLRELGSRLDKLHQEKEDFYNQLFRTKEELKACRFSLDKSESTVISLLDIVARLTKLLTQGVE